MDAPLCKTCDPPRRHWRNERHVIKGADDDRGRVRRSDESDRDDGRHDRRQSGIPVAKPDRKQPRSSAKGHDEDAAAELARRRYLKAVQMQRYRAKQKDKQ